MGFKDYLNKVALYFDTDEVLEEEVVELDSIKVKSSSQVRTNKTVLTPKSQSLQQSAPVNNYHRPKSVLETPRGVQSERPVDQQPVLEKSRIAIKYPRQYEDASEIVSLLIENESVLIDFQYMLDAPARRCLDYLSGASSVLAGNLQKVGSSMYLLTPSHVIVDIEELGLDPSKRENSSFDYDMKRR